MVRNKKIFIHILKSIYISLNFLTFSYDLDMTLRFFYIKIRKSIFIIY